MGFFQFKGFTDGRPAVGAEPLWGSLACGGQFYAQGLNAVDTGLVEDGDACLLSIKVVPRSSRNQIVGFEQGVLKIKVQAPPVEGAANEAVLELLSKQLKRPKSSLEVAAGISSRHKKIRLTGIKAQGCRELLNQPVENGSMNQ